MATVTNWCPFGVALDITATGGTVTRTSATQYTVKINASWETYYSGAKTNYGMTASSGGGSATINAFGTNSGSGSGSFTGTYSISGNGSATKTITVTFRNFNSDNGNSATKTVSFNVTVPAWTSYTITYNANGGSGAPSAQTKWKNQTLTLSSTKPTRTGYSFLGWSTSSSATTATYSAGGSYTANAAATLYAVWKANTYTITYNASGGSGAPAAQTKTHNVTLKLSSTIPTRENYRFKGWGVMAAASTVTYTAGASYTANASATLYALWELIYTKPRITGLTVTRCDSYGEPANDGTYVHVVFDYACDKTLTSIIIDWVSGDETDSYPMWSSDQSGTVDVIIGNGSLSANKTYTITFTVTDSDGSTPVKKTLNGQKYAFHAMPEAKGVALGKPAEIEDYFDVYYNTILRKPLTVYGTLTTDNVVKSTSLELTHATPFIDFHFGNSTADYTSRIIENSSGILTITGGLKINSTLEVTGGLKANGEIYLPNAKRIYGKSVSGTDYEMMRMGGDSTAPAIVIGDGLYKNSIGSTYVNAGSVIQLIVPNDRIVLANVANNTTYSAYFRPNTTGTCTLGTSTNRWYAVYAANATIQTSDAREKTNITPLGASPIMTLSLDETSPIDIHSELFDRLQPVQYNFIKGNPRICYGLIAQDVLAAMEELGIEENELDLVHHEYWPDEETGEEKETFGIAYTNLIAMLIHEVQKLKTELAALETV